MNAPPAASLFPNTYTADQVWVDFVVEERFAENEAAEVIVLCTSIP